ncbi:hypothetical protein AB4Y32_21075 [Paraburkholderia phymatum]|uniref:Uncharacterized protein n=1 Tax=Paraburkholderia phymatum TaxID=148447 RepID=A0ACC6U3V7_9BURK
MERAWRLRQTRFTPAGREPRETFIVYHGNEESVETRLPLADVFVRAEYHVVVVEYPRCASLCSSLRLDASANAQNEWLLPD